MPGTWLCPRSYPITAHVVRLRFVCGACGVRRARWFDWSGSCSRPFQSTRATTATAHKLARVVYHLMRYGAAYVKRTEEQYAPREVREREEKRLKCKARALGYEVVKIEPDAPPAG